jgi:hypothetical protein
VGGQEEVFSAWWSRENYARVGSQTPRNADLELILVLVLLR